MAYSQNPLTGQMSGSMGNFVTTRLGNQNIIRSKAFKPRDANTEPQQKQRYGFKMLGELYPLFGGIPEEGFAQRSKSTTSYIAFMSANMPGALDKSGDMTVIDFSKLTVASGTLPKLIVSEATLDASGIKLTYLPMLRNQANKSTDVLVAMVLLNTGELWIERQLRWSEESDLMLLPVTNVSAADIQGIYLFVKNTEGSKTSNSVYITLNP